MRTLKYLVGSALLAGPATAMASGGGEGLAGLISLAPGSMLYTLITFVILLVVLWKFAWGPIVKGLEEREEKIHGAIEQAQKDREDAEKLLKEYEQKLQEASREIADRMARADKEAQARIAQAQEEARSEGDKLLARARQEIDAEREKVASELRSEVANLAADIAAAAIGEAFDKEDHLRIIKRRLEQVENPS